MRQLLCFCWFTVVFFLLFFYAHNNDTIVSKKEEGKQAHERRRYSLHAFSLLFSNHRHRLLGTYHLAFASSSVSNSLVFFSASSFFEDDDDDEEPRLLVLLLCATRTKNTPSPQKTRRTTAFPSIAPGGFRALIASRPSLNNAMLDLHSSVKSVTQRRRKDIKMSSSCASFSTLLLFLSEDKDESGEYVASSRRSSRGVRSSLDPSPSVVGLPNEDDSMMMISPASSPTSPRMMKEEETKKGALL